MTEEDKTFQALTQRLGEMVKENVELTERVKQLMSDYNKVVKQLQAETENPIVTTDLDIDWRLLHIEPRQSVRGK